MISRKAIIILATAIQMVSGHFLIAQNPGDASIKSKIESYLSGMEQAGFDGAVLVELNGEKIISSGYGYRNREKQIRNTEESVFDIGSITKQFTAAAILKLEMQGKLSTDDTISEYFSNVPSDKKSITIHDLLRHQSGLNSNVGKDYDQITETEFLEKVFASELRFETGTGFSYSNTGYSLLAMIIEKVSGQSYESYLYENLWKPAHMETTGYSRPRFDSVMVAVVYHDDNKPWGRPTEKAWDGAAPYWHLKGNGGILSTVEDLFRWHRALMTDQVLSKEALRKLYEPKLRPGETTASYYAYGWDVSRTSRNTTRIWHNGTNRIYYADFVRFVDEQTTVIMLSNKAHPNFNTICGEISKIIFNPSFQPEIPAADNEVNRAFTQSIIKTIETSGLDQAKAAYNRRKKPEHLLEFMMRNEGFNSIDNQKPDLAMQIFEMNVFVYPNSAKALQGLAEGYMETGNKEQAIIYFEKSLSRDPDNPFVVDMLKRLK